MKSNNQIIYWNDLKAGDLFWDNLKWWLIVEITPKAISWLNLMDMSKTEGVYSNRKIESGIVYRQGKLLYQRDAHLKMLESQP